MSPAHNHPHHPASGGAEPTYGELYTTAATWVDHAARTTTGPFPTSVEAADAVAGYQRFLAVAGRHLALVTGPASASTRRRSDRPPGAVPELIHRLTRLPLPDTNRSAWSRAATALGAAHDLLATHLGSHSSRSTGDPDLLTDKQVRAAAAARLIGLVARAAAVGPDLMTHARRCSRRGDRSAEARFEVAQLHWTVRAVATVARDAQAQLRVMAIPTQAAVTALGVLDAVTPALPTGPSVAGSVQFAAAVTALRVLRSLTNRQATGAQDASPRSLYDLSRLAVTVTDLTATRLPAPTGALERVHRAAQVDHLHAARDAWDTAGTALATQVRGLTAAPGLYKEALTRSAWAIQHPDTTSSTAHTGGAGVEGTDRIDRALLAALPRLAHDAAATITRMARRRELVTPVRRAGGMTTNWVPLTADRADDLAQGFTAAAHASQNAWDLTRATPHWATAPGHHHQGSVPGRRLTPERTVTRTAGVSR